MLAFRRPVRARRYQKSISAAHTALLDHLPLDQGYIYSDDIVKAVTHLVIQVFCFMAPDISTSGLSQGIDFFERVTHEGLAKLKTAAERADIEFPSR